MLCFFFVIVGTYSKYQTVCYVNVTYINKIQMMSFIGKLIRHKLPRRQDSGQVSKRLLNRTCQTTRGNNSEFCQCKRRSIISTLSAASPATFCTHKLCSFEYQWQCAYALPKIQSCPYMNVMILEPLIFPCVCSSVINSAINGQKCSF